QADALDALAKLGDRVAVVLGEQLPADGAPHLLLGGGVGDVRRGLAGPPAQCRGGDLVAPRAVARVVGAGMVVGEVDGDLAVLAGGHGRVELSLLEHGRQCSTGTAGCQVCPVEMVTSTPSGTGMA